MTTVITERNHPHTQTDIKKASLIQKLFAFMTAKGEPMVNDYYRDRKHDMFSSLSGFVLEIGPGTGANLPFYPAGVQWIGIEPNPAMHRYLAEKIDSLDISAKLELGGAERLPMDDASVDTVISTLVLCSVSDVDSVLSEIQRVLKPGGSFLFVEHVAAEVGTGLRTAQNILQPAWTFFADGCHPNRETGTLLKQAGFASVEYESWRDSLGAAVTSPMIAGVATKAS